MLTLLQKSKWLTLIHQVRALRESVVKLLPCAPPTKQNSVIFMAGWLVMYIWNQQLQMSIYTEKNACNYRKNWICLSIIPYDPWSSWHCSTDSSCSYSQQCSKIIFRSNKEISEKLEIHFVYALVEILKTWEMNPMIKQW